MIELTGIGLIVAGIIALFVLMWVVRTAWELVGNIVAGTVAILIAGVAGVPVPVTLLTVLTVIITGLPGALVLIGATIIEPTIVPDLTERFVRLLSFS